MPRPHNVRPGPTPPAPEPRPLPSIEALTSGDDRDIILIRERALNLRDNLCRVADGRRLELASELLRQAVAVALGKV